MDENLRNALRAKRIDVFVISELVDADEVRDLFIRLQSGTALTRQQIRDAWPGTIGPFIERLAGKLKRRPAVTLFKQIDRRGTHSEEESDDYDSDRQFCAQLLCLFLARERDPLSQQSIGANELDKLYHGRPMSEEQRQELSNLFSLQTFREQLLEFLGDRGLSVEVLELVPEWITFIKHYSSVVAECPIIYLKKGPPLRWMDRVVISTHEVDEGLLEHYRTENPSVECPFGMLWTFFKGQRKVMKWRCQ